MVNVPLEIKKSFEQIKKTYPFYVALIHIKGKFYVYRRTSRWDRERKKIRSVSEYLGRIMPDGTYVKKVKKEEQNKISPREFDITEKESKVNEEEKQLLTILSMNARADLAFFGRSLFHISPSEIYRKVRTLEQKYAIKYTAEIDVEKLGYSKFLVMVKFKDRVPTSEEIKTAVFGIPNVQIAVMSSGRYDLMLYVLAKSNKEIADIIPELRKMVLAKYPSEWYVDNFYETFNFIPLRDEFVEMLKSTLGKREHAVLSELNKNGTIGFSDIDKKYGFDPGRADYTYHQLRKKGILIRTTIILQKLPIKYVGILFMDLIDYGAFFRNRKKLLLDIIKDTNQPTNPYLLRGDTGNPDGIIFFIPIFKDGDLEAVKNNFIKLDLSTNISTSVITNVLVGSFGSRYFDYTYSKQYTILVREYGLKPLVKLNYDEIGRTKKSKPTTLIFDPKELESKK